MLDYIIEHFRINSQFINDLDALDQYLNEMNICLLERCKILREVFEYNNKIYSIIKEDNKRLEKIISIFHDSKYKRVIPKGECKIALESQPKSLTKIDVSFYMHQITNCNNLNELNEIIPDKKTDNYLQIIYTIILNLYEEVFEIKRMIYQARNDIDYDTKKYFGNIIDQNQFKINYIKSILKSDLPKKIVNHHSNELIFLKTTYGNVCAYSDMKDITPDFYGQFYDLLESICTGTFKNVKTFTNNEQLKGLSEVRGDETRVIFDRIGSNVYVIIYMFIKKTDKNASYKAALQNRNELYKLNYDDMKLLVNSSEEYLQENRTIKNKIYRILTKKNKIKKIGGIDE